MSEYIAHIVHKKRIYRPFLDQPYFLSLIYVYRPAVKNVDNPCGTLEPFVY